MITTLHIKNIGIIDEININFNIERTVEKWVKL